MNAIDRAIERLEENIELNSGMALFVNAMRQDLSIIRTECADLLGKPLVDARVHGETELTCYHCLANASDVDEPGKFDCLYTDTDVSEHNLQDTRPADCPVDWK